MLTGTNFKNTGELYLRLCCNANYVRYINYIAKGILDKTKTMNKEQFNSIISIQMYGQLTEKRQFSLEADLLIYEKQKLRTDEVISDTFPKVEINYARKVLQSSTYYNNTLVQLDNKYTIVVTDEEVYDILDKNWSEAENHELINALRKLSYNFRNRDTTFQINPNKSIDLFNTLNNRISSLDDTNLEEALKCLIHLREHFQKYLKHTFVLVDKECLQRLRSWKIDKLLLMCDIFFLLSLHYSYFMLKAMGKIGSKSKKLTPKNLVQLLFLINVTRKGLINMYELEVQLEEHLDDLTINELSVVAMGFFKSSNKIRNPHLIRKIINRLIQEITQIDSIALASLVKLLRFSMQYNELVHFNMLLDKIKLITDKLDAMCLVHIGQCSAKACVFDESLVNKIIERVYKEIDHVRIKDLERFTYMLSTFPIDAKHPIFDAIVKQIEVRLSENIEISRYPGIHLNLLYYLSVKDIYPIDLLKVAMSHIHLKNMQSHSSKLNGYNVFLLESSIKIDRPEYDGPFLPTNVYKALIKSHWKEKHLPTSSNIQKLFNEIVYVFKEYVSSTTDLYIGKILPHYLQNDIVIGIDENNEFVSVEPILSKLCEYSPKKVDDNFPKNVRLVAFVIIHYNHKIRGTNEMIGIVKAKLRHLERIGYIPILITDDIWLSHKQLNQKGDFLKHLLQNV